MRFVIYFICSVAFFGIISCKQNDIFTDEGSAVLSFSTDTVQFDTVFTTIGSTTKSFRFYNPNDKAVRTTINLSGGDQSNYRLNIDGVKSTKVTDYEIRGNDSIYVFVEVTVDPQDVNSPMVIEDSITFFTNGNQQDVKLVAYGQDVHLYNDSVIGTQTWTSDKPYLIYNSILIDSLETLTIEAGAQLHFHHNSSMLVAGTLKSQGTLENPIVFQGDRLEQDYKDIPGQWGATGTDRNGNPTEWGAIFFFPGSVGNEINYTTIKNARLGLQVYESQTYSPESCLDINNSTIKNMSLLGLFSVISNVNISNSVIADCGRQSLFSIGGSTNIYHSTLANFFPANYGSREDPSVVIRNYYVDSTEVILLPTSVVIGNSIIDGSMENEIGIEEYPDAESIFNLVFDHCMLKLADTFDISNVEVYKNIMKIESPDSLPRYINKEEYDYRLDTLSAAKDWGSIEIARSFPLDADGNSRLDDDGPDIGAFERIDGLEPEENE